jgi:hypothetical protein
VDPHNNLCHMLSLAGFHELLTFLWSEEFFFNLDIYRSATS